MRYPTTLYPIFGLFFLALVAFPGCSSKSSESPEIKELGAAKRLRLDSSEVEIFDEARRLYTAELYNVAQDSFEELRDSYPLGPFAEFAELKIADCKFFSSEYPEAEIAYGEFQKNHPTSESVPYALYQQARSAQLSSKGLGRDIVPLQNAAALYKTLLEKYSRSFYSEEAFKQREIVLTALRDSDQAVIDFYKKKQNEAAAKARQKSQQESEQLVSGEMAALKQKVVAQKSAQEALQSTSVPLAAPEVLALSRGSKKWLVRPANKDVTARQESGSERASQTPGLRSATLEPATLVPDKSNERPLLFSALDCDRGNLVTVTLRGDLSSSEVPTYLEKSGDTLQFQIPRYSAAYESADETTADSVAPQTTCPAGNVVKIDKTGMLTITGASSAGDKTASLKSASVMVLSRPTRLVLILD